MDSICENERESDAEKIRVVDSGKTNVKFDLSDEKDDGNFGLQTKTQSNCKAKTADLGSAEKSMEENEKLVIKVSSACPICGSDKPVHTCQAVHEHTTCEAANLEDRSHSSQCVDEIGPTDEEEPASFVVIHLGSAVVDRRFPPKSIMPWVMAEVKRSKDTFKEVCLQVLSHTIKAVSYEDCATKSIRTVFEHKLHGLSRFAKTHQDPRCFGYLRRESLYSDFECHVFLANDEKVVCIPYTCIKEVACCPVQHHENIPI